MTTLKINGKTITVNAQPDTPLLWVLRGELNLVGTSSVVARRCAARVPCTSTARRCARASRRWKPSAHANS